MFYVVNRVSGTTIAYISIPISGYILQAIGIVLYSRLFALYPKKINNKYTSITIIIIYLLLITVFQITDNITLILAISFIFNFLSGVIFQMYLIYFTSYVPNKYRGTCFGIAYAIGSLFTTFITLVDNGKFIESPYMAIIYSLMATIACILILQEKDAIVLTKEKLSSSSKTYLKVLIISIIGFTVIMGLGDSIYNFGSWTSDVDFRIVRVFYGVGLVIAGIINDHFKRLGAILAFASLSYYLISVFLLKTVLSPLIIMSLSYAFMGFASVYRFTAFADIADEHPQFIPYSGLGLAISRVIEALVTIFLFIVPLTLTQHIIITFVLYTPIIVLAFISDGLKFQKNQLNEENKLTKFAEKYNLTSRELEIYTLLLVDASDEEISSKLFISKPTVRFHISNILKKTKTNSRVSAKRLYTK